MDSPSTLGNVRRSTYGNSNDVTASTPVTYNNNHNNNNINNNNKLNNSSSVSNRSYHGNDAVSNQNSKPLRVTEQQNARSKIMSAVTAADVTAVPRRALPAVSVSREEIEKKRRSLTENINEKLKEMCLDTRSVLRDRLRAKYGLEPEASITSSSLQLQQPASALLQYPQQPLSHLSSSLSSAKSTRSAFSSATSATYTDIVQRTNAHQTIHNDLELDKSQGQGYNLDDDDGRSVTSVEVANIMAQEPVLSDSEYGSSPLLDDNGNYDDVTDTDDEDNASRMSASSIAMPTASPAVQQQGSSKQKVNPATGQQSFSAFAEQSMANFLGFVSPGAGAAGGRLKRAGKNEDLYRSSLGLDNAGAGSTPAAGDFSPDKNNNSGGSKQSSEDTRHRLTMFALLRTHNLLPLSVSRRRSRRSNDAIDLTDLNMYVDGKLQGQVVAVADHDPDGLIVSGGQLQVSDIIVEVRFNLW
jgi:hypothetical protein